MEGIDVSYWQQDNYKRLIDIYAKDFVIARATFDFGVDQFCDPIYQYAKSKGKNLGVYFFPLTESSDPETSADWCVEQVKGYIGNTVFFLDWERTNGTDVSKTWWALRWLKRFEEKSGVKPNIYMNTSTVREFNWSEIAANDNGLWLADYGSNDGYDHGVPDIPYWSIVMMHQYTSIGDGGAGLDKDVFFGDVKAWNAYAGIKEKIEPVVNELDKYTDEQLADMVIDGKFGNGDDRKNKLGNRYDSVQAIVNRKVEEKLKSNKKYYTIQSGDTLTAISEKFGTPINQLCSWNNIANPDMIYAGDRIRVK